jgi:1-aminocyclopropane-1-carboxylate deaminase
VRAGGGVPYAIPAGASDHRRVIGIDASAKLGETRAQVEKIARNTAELIGLGRDLREDEITVLSGWAGERYGVPDQSTLDAIRLLGRLEGVILDPVYEGKSMAGLIGLVASGEIGKDSTVLYAHLGGQPALSAYGSLFCRYAGEPGVLPWCSALAGEGRRPERRAGWVRRAAA